MRLRGGWARVAVPMILVVAATMIPYVFAWARVSGEAVFSGFLLNPLDGFSYLAKIRQGAEGSWLFHLPYAAEPGEGSFLFVFYLALGHLSRLTSISPLITLHLARGVGAIAMYLAASAFMARMIPEGKGRSWGWSMVLIGSGLGWLGIPFGLLPLDLWVPEAVPALAAYASAHFPFAIAAMCLGGMAISPAYRGRHRLALAAASGLLLALIQPFAVGVIAAVGGLWLAIEAFIDRGQGSANHGRGSMTAWLALLGGAAPILIYDGWAVLTHPVLAAWNRQNLTPSPSLLETALAFLPLLLLAGIGLADPGLRRQKTFLFLVVWSITTLVLLYAPFGLQRRLALGLYLPLAALAAIAIASITHLPRWIPYAILILTLPSHMVVVAAGLSGALDHDPSLVLGRDEVAAYEWMDANIPPGSLVLAGVQAGNRIPAFADLRVIYGHPFETPNAPQERAWVEAVYGWNGSTAGVLSALRLRGVDYVFVGPEERSLGSLAWLASLEPDLAMGGLAVYPVPPP